MAPQHRNLSDARKARALLAAVTLMVALVSCARTPPTTNPTPATGNATGELQQSAPKMVRGLLVELRPGSLSGAGGFTLLTEDGRELDFELAPGYAADPGHPMSPGHLQLHLTGRDPVTVTYREENGILLATRLVD